MLVDYFPYLATSYTPQKRPMHNASLTCIILNCLILAQIFISERADRVLCSLTFAINALSSSDAYMSQKTESALVQPMVRRLCGAKPFTKSMLTYC